jgi:hypothetical protein
MPAPTPTIGSTVPPHRRRRASRSRASAIVAGCFVLAASISAAGEGGEGAQSASSSRKPETIGGGAERWLAVRQSSITLGGREAAAATASAATTPGSIVSERPPTPSPSSGGGAAASPTGEPSAPAATMTPAPAAPQANPTPAPASPTPAPTAATAAVPSESRCPTPLPAAAPPGWTRVVTSTFSENVQLGQWPGPVAAQAWKNRARGGDSSGRGTYDSSRTVTEANGLLDVWVHSEGSTRYVAAPVSTLGGMLGARISICMRADQIPGYKVAFLLWPTDGEGNQLGEIDFPEGKLAGGGATAKAFMHHAGAESQDAFDSGVALQGWHTYTIEWDPTASQPYVSFFLDGRLLGTATDRVPIVPMFYVMQIETYLRGDPLPPPAAGHVQVDWVTIDRP